MDTSASKNRTLLVFFGELVEGEEVISKAFSELCDLCGDQRPNSRLIHRCVRSILMEATAISLLLFPSATGGKATKNRAAMLRETLQVEEESLLKDRVLRNHLAHLDERLDAWASKSEMRVFGRGMLGSREHARKLGLADEDILGMFDPKSFVYCFISDEIRVDDLVGEVRAISHKARSISRDLSWDDGNE